MRQSIEALPYLGIGTIYPLHTPDPQLARSLAAGTIQYNTIYYARRPVLTERALVANAYIQRLLFVLVSPSPCCATHCSICIRIFLKPILNLGFTPSI